MKIVSYQYTVLQVFHVHIKSDFSRYLILSCESGRLKFSADAQAPRRKKTSACDLNRVLCHPITLSSPKYHSKATLTSFIGWVSAGFSHLAGHSALQWRDDKRTVERLPDSCTKLIYIWLLPKPVGRTQNMSWPQKLISVLVSILKFSGNYKPP